MDAQPPLGDKIDSEPHQDRFDEPGSTTKEMSIKQMFPEWCEHADEHLARRKAEQEFVNAMIDNFDKADVFRAAPDHDDLHLIAELAVRMVHSCYKTGTGPMRGFGIRTKFMSLMRAFGRQKSLKEARSDYNRRERLKKLREENKELKRLLAEARSVNAAKTSEPV